LLAAGAADRAAASDGPHRAVAVALAAIGAPLVLLVLHGPLVAALMLAVCIGAGQMVTEVAVDTTLQRRLDPAVFARSYGLVVPACVGGIVLGALLAAPCVALVGLDATLALTGAAVLAYGVVAFGAKCFTPIAGSASISPPLATSSTAPSVSR
jgi:predicted MFS family arabinose efflux permease